MYVCIPGVRNVIFPEHFANVPNEWTPTEKQVYLYDCIVDYYERTFKVVEMLSLKLYMGLLKISIMIYFRNCHFGSFYVYLPKLFDSFDVSNL